MSPPPKQLLDADDGQLDLSGPGCNPTNERLLNLDVLAQLAGTTLVGCLARIGIVALFTGSKQSAFPVIWAQALGNFVFVSRPPPTGCGQLVRRPPPPALAPLLSTDARLDVLHLAAPGIRRAPTGGHHQLLSRGVHRPPSRSVPLLPAEQLVRPARAC